MGLPALDARTLADDPQGGITDLAESIPDWSRDPAFETLAK
jgi:hypothetical protein